MTLEERIASFDINKLTHAQRETLHSVRTLATWLYLVRYVEEKRRKAA